MMFHFYMPQNVTYYGDKGLGYRSLASFDHCIKIFESAGSILVIRTEDNNNNHR